MGTSRSSIRIGEDHPPAPEPVLSLLTIQEVARRTGVSKITLRAWERRYGVPRPEKTPKGYRLYSERQVREIASIVRLGASGVATRQAAFLVARQRTLSEGAGATKSIRSWRSRLEAACLRFDEAAAQQVLHEAEPLLSHFDLLQKVVLPVVATFGDGREAGVITISQEHFASVLARNVVARSHPDLPDARGPLVLTGCAPGEQHELGILAVVCGLRDAGHRVVHLGANVPVTSLLATADRLKARTVIVAVTLHRNLRPWVNRAAEVKRRMQRGVSFVWAGPGAATAARQLPGRVGTSIEQAIDQVRQA